jgi:hypothetical protein
MPTTPYPHPKSNTLSCGKKSTTDNIANVPVSIEWGEKTEGTVSNTMSTSLILAEIITYLLAYILKLSYHNHVHNSI